MNEILLKKHGYRLVALATGNSPANLSDSIGAGSKIYTLGGLGASSTSIGDFSVYDIGTNKHTTLASSPTPVRSCALGQNGNFVYCYGGYNQGPNTITREVKQYNIASNTWSINSAQLPVPRYDFASNCTNGVLHIFGGIENATTITTNCYKVDLKTSTTPVSIASSPVPIRRAATLHDGRFIYVGGGLNGSSAYLDGFYRYDTLNNSWATLSPLPVKTSSLSFVMWDDVIFAFTTNQDGVYANKLYAYNVQENSWSFVGDVDGEIHGGLTSGVVYNEELYLVGGYNGSVRHSKTSKLIRY